MACANGVCGLSRPTPTPNINRGVPMATKQGAGVTATPVPKVQRSGLDKFKQFFTGKPGEVITIPKFTPEQDAFRQQLLGMAEQGLNKPYAQFQPQGGINQLLKQLLGQQSQSNQTLAINPQTQQLLQQTLGGSQTPQGYGFGPIEQRARQQFENKTIPGLAERFTSMGGQSRQGSSAFQGALGQAGSDLESQLAALRSQYGMQERQQLGQEQGQRQGLLGNLLGYGLQGQAQGTRQNLAQQNLLGQLLGSQGQQAGLNQNLLLNLLQQGLHSPFESAYQPPTGGFLGGIGQGLGNAGGLAGAAGLKYLTGGLF